MVLFQAGGELLDKYLPRLLHYYFFSFILLGVVCYSSAVDAINSSTYEIRRYLLRLFYCRKAGASDYVPLVSYIPTIQ